MSMEKVKSEDCIETEKKTAVENLLGLVLEFQNC